MMIGFLIAIISGALMSVQGVFNTQVTKASGIWAAAAFVEYREESQNEQLDMFSLLNDGQTEKEEKLRREENIQRAIIGLKKKYGKNSVVKGTNLKKGATGMQRNDQIGGHKA